MMNLRVNGEEKKVTDRCTVQQLLAQLKLGRGPVAVERNGQVVPRASHPQVELAEGDVIEIVHFVGGG